MISELTKRMGDEANDIRLNLESVLEETGAPGLSQNQIYGIALACAFATKHSGLVDGIHTLSFGALSAEEVQAAKTAAVIMAMNNIYYRAGHLSEDEELEKLPARLRMNGMSKTGIPKNDFELYCTAVSAINGCGKCIKSHVHELRKNGVGTEAIHSAIRIASVINASAQAMSI
jgi:alkyl hydroperoxide reductase subunit D